MPVPVHSAKKKGPEHFLFGHNAKYIQLRIACLAFSYFMMIVVPLDYIN
jgi:hypothetical protein